MIQYIFLLINNVVLKIGSAIDAGFANSISLGVICVFAILDSIHNFLVAFYEYGAYYFRIYNCRAKAGLVFNVIVSIFCSVIFVVCADYFKFVYYIEPQYEQLLKNCVTVAFLYFPFESGTCYMRDVLVYSGKERYVSIVNVLFYCTLIPLDAAAVFMYHSVVLVLAGTGVSYFISFVLLYLNAPFRKDFFKTVDVIVILKDGLPVFYNRLLSEFCHLLVNIFGSKLGTVYYAMFSIIRMSLGSAQLCIHPVEPVIITKMRGCRDITYKKVFVSFKNIIALGCVSYFVLGYIVMFVSRGDLVLSQIFFAVTIINAVSVGSYLFYVIGKSIISIQKKNDLIKNTATIRLCTTILMCVVSYLFRDSVAGLACLALYRFITDSIASLYLFVRMRMCT